MTHIIMPKDYFMNPPECPLCGKKFHVSLVINPDGSRTMTCKKCNIWINTNDPCVNKWYVIDENFKVTCPRPGCEEKMNHFVRSDGYMKAKCPKCGAGMEVADYDENEVFE